ncbi:uncharacterized protein MONOS_16098 [Monocercomonoides exilis]|uniref:uncharacterized protein n=1 Tax=Monocercomonoides exilis TaxID=2049356 RepID=UPI00355AB5CE|nr:hypothetical protein MONOS_16098 [Monocercomonoides exilis]|eukprot:MONOS_16098.1-p1 / transcript=MONOS_16098.1 / gene=MONOS_16098 / organism=Monocercomonoides_exilis_PA203 / gene_product=unspecified product / transcript_product=unspecified product / location=Mono_scaffold01503:1770-2860(+) / protein_length=292 / sequence_SO=supercontig / SO=protein_coding / is_pseudo=false
MEMHNKYKSNNDVQELSLAEKFSKLLDQLDHCNETEQKQKIPEMNEIIDGMNNEELKSIFTEERFDKIYKMIEEKKMTMENVILLLKHAGNCNVLKNVWNRCFERSSLRGRLMKMIIEEDKKNEEKNEKLLVDLCECYILPSCSFSSGLLSICVPCLLKAALKKEEDEETQKEVEIALLALSNLSKYVKVPKELFLDEIKEIIEYHQEHHNLTQLAYQSAWQFLIKRFIRNKSYEDIVNELHFAREASRELEELSKYCGTRNWSDLSAALFRCFAHQGADMKKFGDGAFIP